MNRELLKAWVHWALKNPFNEDQLAHAEATNELLDELESLRQNLAVAEEALGFYASISIWGNGCAAIDPCDTYFCDKNVLRGGIKAHDALAKIRGEG